MTKHFFAILLLTFYFAQFSVGQDLLINTSGDTLNVSLEKIQSGYIHYKQQGKRETEKFPVNRVFLYSTDFFKAPLKPANVEKLPKVTDVNKAMDIPTLRISVQGGLSYFLGASSEGAPKNTDMNLGAGVDLFFDQNIGAGLGYSLGIFGENITIQYLSPKILARVFFAQNRASLNIHVSAGYVWYKQKTFIGNITSNNFGGGAGIGLDYRLNYGFAIGVDANLLVAFLKKYESPRAIELNGVSNISRVDLSIGLRWYL